MVEAMKFAFAGYDFFVDTISPLLKSGWVMTDAVVMEMDGFYNSHTRLLDIGRDLNAEIIFRPADKPKQKPIDAAYLQHLETKGVDVLISAAYGHKIPVEKDLKIRIINIHPTILPQGRGPWPLPHVILKGLAESGVTVHKVSAEFDEGDILLSKSFPVQVTDNLESVTYKSRLTAVGLMEELSTDFNRLWESALPQAGESSYWPNFEWDKDRVIDWHRPVSEISKLVRAFGKFDTGATINGQDWLVQDVTAWSAPHTYQPGQLVVKGGRELLVAASDGFVLLRECRLET